MVSYLLHGVFYKFILSLSAGAAVVITSSITLQHKTKEIKLFDNVIEAISMSEVKKVFVAQLGQSNMRRLSQTNYPDNIDVHLLDIVSYSSLSVSPYTLPIISITGYT